MNRSLPLPVALAGCPSHRGSARLGGQQQRAASSAIAPTPPSAAPAAPAPASAASPPAAAGSVPPGREWDRACVKCPSRDRACPAIPPVSNDWFALSCLPRGLAELHPALAQNGGDGH